MNPPQNPGSIPSVIKTLIGRAKGHSNPLHVVSLLGVAVDVKLRLKNVKDDSLKQVNSELKVSVASCVQMKSLLRQLFTSLKSSHSTTRLF